MFSCWNEYWWTMSNFNQFIRWYIIIFDETAKEVFLLNLLWIYAVVQAGVKLKKKNSLSHGDTNQFTLMLKRQNKPSVKKNKLNKTKFIFSFSLWRWFFFFNFIITFCLIFYHVVVCLYTYRICVVFCFNFIICMVFSCCCLSNSK